MPASKKQTYRAQNCRVLSWPESIFREHGLMESPWGGAGTDWWEIEGVQCSHFFIYDENQEPGQDEPRRVPRTGYLAPGEFEDRFRSRQTIEFIFEHGLGTLGPAALALAVDKANERRSATDLRILDITARGGLPRAVIEVAETVSKEQALSLVATFYKEQMLQLHREIDGLKKGNTALLRAVSQGILLPAPQTRPSMDSAKGWAEYFKVPYDALRKRLERHRNKHAFDANMFKEVQSRGTRDAQYLYPYGVVAPIACELKKASRKRPSGKK